MKTIAIIGSRRRDTKKDFEQCKDIFLSVYEDGDKIVSGGCPKGGDKFAEIIAEELKLTVENGKLILYLADWDKYGKGAGFIRNTYIAQDADIVIAVVSKDRTGGTEDTLKKAVKMGKKIILVEDNDDILDFDPLDL